MACSLYALGFSGYFWEFFLKYVPGFAEGAFGFVSETGAGLIVTFLIGVMFVRLNARGTGATGMTENVLTVSKLLIMGVFIAYGLRAVGGEPTEAVEAFNPFFPQGMSGVLVAMGLTFIAFEGYDLVVLRAARAPYLQQVVFGEIPEKVALFSPASVLVVKRF
jgi:amino acid transporter